MDKKLYNTGIWAYFILTIMALVFYKERIILLDNAFFLFDIVRTGNFVIHHDRYIAVLTEMFPVVATRLSLPLKWVIMSYSFGFIIWYFVFYVICGNVLKNYRAALVILLLNLLFAAHTYYWGISELPLGMAFMVMVWALATTEKRIPAYLLYPLLIIGIMVAGLSHPLIIFPFFFVSAFVFLSSDMRMNRWLWSGINIVFIITILLKKYIFSDSYESQSMGGLSNFKTLFPNYFNLYSHKHFISNWLSLYYWIPVVLVLITILYIRQKNRLKLILVYGAFAGYTLLINVCFPDGYAPDFYMENLYLPLSLILAVPLVYDVLPALFKPKVASTLFLFILLTGIARIYIQHNFYRDRIDWYRGYLDKYGHEKAIVADNTVPAETLLFPWATCYEFWLLSTLERNKTASILITENVDELSWVCVYTNDFVSKWGVFGYKELNPVYFKFTDSSSHYSIYKER
ncbi:MAG: hypothetical protein H6550_03870 [Chitinophagales bacterium]|nr:hypothetical protein [Chitinophagales bacterium]